MLIKYRKRERDRKQNLTPIVLSIVVLGENGLKLLKPIW